MLKINGKYAYLQRVQQNGSPVLQETSNIDEATKFEMTGDEDCCFQLADLPGGSKLARRPFERLSEDGKTYLRTHIRSMYLKLEGGRVEETENVEQCLEVAAWGWFAFRG